MSLKLATKALHAGHDVKQTQDSVEKQKDFPKTAESFHR